MFWLFRLFLLYLVIFRSGVVLAVGPQASDKVKKNESKCSQLLSSFALDAIQKKIPKTRKEWIDHFQQVSIEGDKNTSLTAGIPSFPSHEVQDSDLNFYFERRKQWENKPDLKNLYWRYANFRKGNYEKFFLSAIPNSFYERWLTRDLIEREHFFIEIIETRAEDYLWNSKDRPPGHGDTQLGRATQRRWINEIMATVLPEYAERRDWSMSFIDDLYKKAMLSADLTRYVTIRSKNADGVGPGKIVAVLGLNRAPYGTIQFFNRSTNQWEQRTAPFGLSYEECFGRQEIEPSMYLSAWTGKVPILGMEEYLDIRLPRPGIVDNIIDPMSESKFNFIFHPGGVDMIPGLNPDPSKSIYFGSGELFEPVKFYVDPEIPDRGSAYTELISAILEFLIPEHRGVEYATSAQHLYTYNPRDGIMLYRSQGFRPDHQFDAQNKDGQTWHVLGASVPNFARRFHATSRPPYETTAQNIIEKIRETVDQFLTSRETQSPFVTEGLKN